MSETKPFITYTGQDSLVSEQLSSQITHDLPQEGVEWQRSYGRGSKTVYLEAQLLQLTESHLEIDENDMQLSLSHKPLLHTYWTDCWDVDTYKTSIRDAINVWMNQLKDHGITDWLIIQLDNSEQRKGMNKSKLLPRSSVLDKIKSDFPSSKNLNGVERCVTLIDQQRNDSKASDSYQLFLQRLRALLLQSYSRQLLKYEDYIRTQRENRTAPNWNFFDFFFLQEELGFTFEMLSLYDEALVQYDELDALFSQLVINSHVGAMADWLARLSEKCDTWNGLCLTANGSKTLRDDLQKGKGTLLDLRNYLFSRQCELLILLNKPWELASRSLPFLQNCVNELNILEISVMPGGIACWVFLSALEILQTCERYSDSSQMETYSLHTVALWAYARSKLSELGLLCGLMPGLKITSECLHMVVNLIAGMGNDMRIDESTQSPQSKLKEALSGQEAFLKHYLEVSELTMGTYKHIGRMRCARLIGKDLARVYMKMKNAQKAIPFLIDLEKMYIIEKWPSLVANIRQLLLECYQMLDDERKKFKTHFHLAASPALPLDARVTHFEQANKYLESNDEQEVMLLRMDEIFSIHDLELKLNNNHFTVTNSTIEIILTLNSHLPMQINCKQVLISLKTEQVPVSSSKSQNKSQQICTHAVASDPPSSTATNSAKLDLETFHNSVSVGVKCSNMSKVLKRTDSHGLFLMDKEPIDDQFEKTFIAENVVLKEGMNEIKLAFKSSTGGCFTLSQLKLRCNANVSFISTFTTRHVCFNVIAEEPSLNIIQLTTLDGQSREILAGVNQSLVLQLNCGSFSFEEGTSFTIRPSRGLLIKLETNIDGDLGDMILLKLSNPLSPFQTFTIPLVVYSKLLPQRDVSSAEHQLSLYWAREGSGSTKSISATFHLTPCFVTSFKLHTCNMNKFIEVLVNGISKSQIALKNARLKQSDDVTEVDLQSKLPLNDLILKKDQLAHYMWEIVSSDANKLIKKAIFTIDYKLMSESLAGTPTWETFESEFKLHNYQTMYTIKEAVEPIKGSEFCKVGNLCNLNVVITKVMVNQNENEKVSIMYEVIADQTMWSLSGRTAGVASVDHIKNYNVTFEVMPLMSGFLPLPNIRISKYISNATSNVSSEKPIPGAVGSHHEAKLVAFENGQVYNWSRASQVHVLPSSGLIVPEG